VSCKIYSFRS